MSLEDVVRNRICDRCHWGTMRIHHQNDRPEFNGQEKCSLCGFTRKRESSQKEANCKIIKSTSVDVS